VKFARINRSVNLLFKKKLSIQLDEIEKNFEFIRISISSRFYTEKKGFRIIRILRKVAIEIKKSISNDE
jgi:hypothetical protein